MSEHRQPVGVQIRDKAFYDTQHDNVQVKSHLAEMEQDALCYLRGIAGRDQEKSIQSFNTQHS